MGAGESNSAIIPRQKTLNDKELGFFVKVYVKTQKLRQEYEASIEVAQDSKEKERVQQDTATKLEKVLRDQGLNVESYNRVFAVANADEELRRKALKLIDAERKSIPLITNCTKTTGSRRSTTSS